MENRVRLIRGANCRILGQLKISPSRGMSLRRHKYTSNKTSNSSGRHCCQIKPLNAEAMPRSQPQVIRFMSTRALAPFVTTFNWMKTMDVHMAKQLAKIYCSRLLSSDAITNSKQFSPCLQDVALPWQKVWTFFSLEFILISMKFRIGCHGQIRLYPLASDYS